MSYIHVQGLSKHFDVRLKREKGSLTRPRKRVQALQDVSFDINRGELVGYIGPNGAGKSTSVKILSGILTPDSGDVTVGGQVPWKERKAYVRRIGVVFPEGCSAPAGVPLIPTQLFSAAGDLLIVCLLLVYERRKAAYRTLAPTYFFLYGTGRFCIEFLRDDPRGSVGALSTSQFISVFVVILSAVLYWWEGRKHQKAASHP